MKEWSTFYDGEDCRECKNYEKEILKLRQHCSEALVLMKKKDAKINELIRWANHDLGCLFHVGHDCNCGYQKYVNELEIISVNK